MKSGIFTPGEPNNKDNKEFCVLCPEENKVWDVPCLRSPGPYAVCEINLDFQLTRSHETTVSSYTDLNYDEDRSLN